MSFSCIRRLTNTSRSKSLSVRARANARPCDGICTVQMNLPKPAEIMLLEPEERMFSELSQHGKVVVKRLLFRNVALRYLRACKGSLCC